MSLGQRLFDQFWEVKPEIFRAEVVTTILVLILAYLFGGRMTGVWRRLAYVADRRWMACGVVVFFVLAARLALLPVVPMPDPMIRDEFSHLLGAETYALGRIANPTHPQWIHFEAPYTIQRPTFVSAYPPGQALPMAAAIALGLNPWWAVWLSTGMMCGTLCWALQGWLPPRWAFLVAMTAALRYGILSYWMNSYWGGIIPALGGALAIGALPRLSTGGPAAAVCFAGGLVLTIFARPYEGLLLAAALMAAVLWSSYGHPHKFPRLDLRRLLKSRIMVPALLVLSAGGSGFLYYCWRTTGTFQLPYEIFIQEYWAARHFIPMALPPERKYRHDVFNSMAAPVRNEHLRARSVAGFLKLNAERAMFWWTFYCGPLLSLPLILGFRAFFDQKTRPLLIAAGVFAAGLSMEVPRMPHYAAPFTAAWLIIWVRAARHAAVLRYGRGLVRLIPLALAVLLMYRVAKLVTTPADPPKAVHWKRVLNWCCVPRGIVRADLERDLKRIGGQHLVFFRTPADRMITFDWVYNKPDVDAAQIVWARAMSETEDAALCAYYPDRRSWLVDATLPVPAIRPYCNSTNPNKESR
jgi:hypothetical protein